MSPLGSTAGLLALERDATPNAPQDLLPNLPFDIISEIVNHLPLQSLLRLTQTCSSLRRALVDRLRLEAQRASKQELLECLTVVAEARPDAWVCQECVAIHGADYRDTPHRRALACPRLRYIPLHAGPRDDDYQLHHHHVQLALKYSRLKNPTPEQKHYLQQLLAPHTRANFRINPHDVRGNMLSASYTVTPKIVNGRYVRKCIWAFSRGVEYPSRDSVGAVALCCHLPTAPIRQTDDDEAIRRWHGSMLTTALTRALAFENTAWSHCHFCALDFEVTPAPQREGLTIEAWQDLGPEGSIYHANWRAVAWDSRQHSIVQHMAENRLVVSDPGSVRNLYGERSLVRTGEEIEESESWADWYLHHSTLYHPLEEA